VDEVTLASDFGCPSMKVYVSAIGTAIEADSQMLKPHDIHPAHRISRVESRTISI
jgi:hypothetical protein